VGRGMLRARMGVLALKLLMAPAFVVGASVTARRFGPLVGGLVAGLPVVGGPILLVLAVVHGTGFAGRAASASLLGLTSLALFVMAYGSVVRRVAWPAAVVIAWTAFAAGTVAWALITDAIHIPPTAGLALAFLSFLLARTVLPRPAAADAPPARREPPSWDLPVRAACAAAMVLTLSAAASGLGAHISGLLAPAPIITTILAAFTQAQLGPDATLRLLRGMTTGFFTFATFCWILAIFMH
jgi:hypothetical protein